MKKIIDVIISVAIVLALGAISGVAASGAEGVYESLAKPSFAPPAKLFGIVWPLLYITQGIVLYRLYFYFPEKNDTEEVKTASNLFAVQLAVNLLWSPIFFVFYKFWIAFAWSLLLVGVAWYTFIKIKRFDSLSWYISLPYLVWVVLASVLNFFVAWMN